MSTLKTFTSAVTAAALVGGIGFAVAQTQDRQDPPADPATTAVSLQQQPVDPTRSPPPADPNAPLPAQDPAQQQRLPAGDAMSPTPSTYDSDPAPRADRN